MKANELNIGNWVLEESYNNEHIELMVDSGTYIDSQIKYIEPIPLTEEWLEKFGAKENKIELGQDLWIELDFNSIAYPYYNVFLKQLNVDNKLDIVLMDIELGHVHQLQNLYFALTGEELEIKQNVIKNV